MSRLLNFMNPSMKVNVDEEIFEKIFDFILNLEPEQLNDSQLETLTNILEEVDFQYDNEDNEEISEIRKAKRSTASEKKYGKQYYLKNKQKIKRKRKKFRKSAEGKRLLKKKKIMSKMNRTATGRKKVKYHT